MKFQSLITLGALALSAGLGAAQVSAPTGELDIDTSLVRSGSKPVVNWTIRYPKNLDDLVDVDDPGEITVKSRTEVEIRVLGVAFQSSSGLLPAAVQAEVNGTWTTLFSGTSENVDPSESLYKGVLEAGDTLNFSARGGRSNGEWSFSANTLSDSQQVTHLRDGDSIPNYVPAFNQGTIEDYLSGFVTPESSLVAGPRDIVYLFELGSTNTSSSYFDMQDVAMVVTFKDVEED